MKLIGSVGLLIALAALTGCSPQAKGPNDVFAAMNAELAHTIPPASDSIAEMDDALSHTIGTTMLTSATLVASPSILQSPMPLPESRMPLSEDAPAAVQTWGASAEAGERPSDRE